MKNVIITGASGLVATELTLLLLETGETNLFLLSRNPNDLEKRYIGKSNVHCFDLEDFQKFACGHGDNYDCLVHTAFARSSDGHLLADTLEYTCKVLELVKQLQVKTFVNISSQSVYGQVTPPLWKEDTSLAPDYMYALGKVAEEMLVETMLQGTTINYTSLRLSSVCENARFLNVFVKNALDGLPIKVLGGNQICSFIDVRDVATALKRVIEMGDILRYDRVYNLGTGRTVTIWELANLVRKVAKERYGIDAVIEREEKDIQMAVGMDSSKFMNAFRWRPEKSDEDMIVSLFECLTDVKTGGLYPMSFSILYGRKDECKKN